ncbi:MAG: Swt1 family HEPN domain-containing protein [Devosia sp.]|nr:Swt1 family HEPN domain-containing protein [Devosia sp.]
MPLDISKLGFDTSALTASADLQERISRATRASDLITRTIQGSVAMNKVMEDIERSNRLMADQLSPLSRWYEEHRLISEGIASQFKAITEGSSVVRMAEQMRQLTEGVGAIGSQLKILSEDSGIARAFKDADRLGAAFRSAYPFDDHALGLAALPKFDLSAYALPAYEEVGAISRLLHERLSEPLERFSAGITAAMTRMNTPWLSLENPLISATAFAELQTVGQLIGSRAPFGIDLSATLRESLGDWRDPVSFVPEVQPHEVRAQVYADRGLRQELVEFPDEAFDEGMVLAGLVPLDEELDAETAEGLRRTRAIQRLLLELEVRLRRVVDEAMTAAFGQIWMRGRTPNGMADQWEDKRNRDELAGGLPLIEYADFTDYVVIVLRRDNWSEVFRHVFGRRDADVRESFQRLHPARVTAAHNRPLGRDDYLVAAAEIRRLLLAIGRRRN